MTHVHYRCAKFCDGCDVVAVMNLLSWRARHANKAMLTVTSVVVLTCWVWTRVPVARLYWNLQREKHMKIYHVNFSWWNGVSGCEHSSYPPYLVKSVFFSITLHSRIPPSSLTTVLLIICGRMRISVGIVVMSIITFPAHSQFRLENRLLKK